MQLPAIDQNVCGQWTQVDKDYYNKLPYYLTGFQSDYLKKWQKWGKILPKRLKWQPNMGATMRRVAQEWSPNIRQEAIPQLISDVPTTDVTFTRERSFDVQVYRHRFQTREFWFLPEWQDFFRHLEHEYEDLQQQITNYYELFLRTRVFHHSPSVYLAGVGLTNAPTGIPNAAGTAAKSDATISSWLEQPIEPLTLTEIFKVISVAMNQVGMTPYKGSGMPQENKGLDVQYKLLMDNEAFLQFTNDPWAKENRMLTVDITNNTFKGSLFGMVQCDFERYPLRYKYAAGTVTRPNPETVLESASQLEQNNRTAPNPDYTTNAQYGVAFLIGGDGGYDAMDVGPPPATFTKSVESVKGMNWNGKADWTKKFLIQCKNGDGTAVTELNETWGEHMRAQAQLAMSIAPSNAYNVLPIIYKRNIGLTTVG